VDPEKRIETRLNEDGTFVFDNVSAGEYRVFATALLGCTISQGEQTVTLENGQVVNVELSVTYSRMRHLITEFVTVSAGLEQSIEEVSKTVDVIDSQEMRDRADFSLAETLRTIPGFRVQQLGGFGKTANIKTRGLRNQDTAILIDGIRFRDPSAIPGDASPFLSDFTLTSVSKIEVLRGSGSSLYGTNAIGGVIDLQTPQAESGTHGQIGGALGGLGLGRFRGNVSHGTAGRRFGIGAGLSRTVYTRGVDGDDRAENTNFQTRMDVKPFDSTNISGRIFFSDAKVRLNSNPDTFGTLPPSNAVIIDANPNVNFIPDVNDPDDFQRSRFFSGQFVINQVISNRLVLSGYYQGLGTKRTNETGPLGVGSQSASTSVFKGSIHTANAHMVWSANGANTVTAGYEFERETYRNEGRTPLGTSDFFSRAAQQSNTFYVQDLVSLADRDLQLAGGLRIQHFGLDQPSFSVANAPYDMISLHAPPNAVTFDGAISYYFPKTGTKLRGHVGNGYRVPSLFERFGTFFDNFSVPNRFVALGDPFLRPEKSIAFDAGIEQDAFKRRLSMSATYFYTQLSQTIGFGNVVPNIGTTMRPFGGYINQIGGISRGVEFSTRIKPKSSTDIFASYTFTNSDQRAPQVTGSGVTTTLGIPDHQFTLVATQRFGHFWLNFDLLATSRYLAPIFDTNGFTFQTYIYRFKGNRKGDLTAGYTFGFRREKMTLRIYSTVENVFDQEYYENGFRTAGATGRFGLSFGF
jgi:iron complex outermembrane receptor protein